MKYEVTISRISYSTLTFGVEAEDKDQAVELALDEAYNTGWSENSANYDVEDVSETELTDEEWEEEFGGKGDGAF
jgi:hypothetical protein